MSTHVVILGAGFGGLELSSRLSAELADEVHVTLIDQSDSFIFGFSKLDVMFGRRTMDEVRIPYRDITRPGVTFRQESVLSIDPGRKRVVTNAGGYNADVLVVALGADLAPEATPGVDECGHEFYSPDGAARVRDLLPAFPGGNVVIAVLGGFFKCPPAPYETAVMLHDNLARRGVRDATTIHLVTPMPKPIPISDETSDALTGLLDERGIRQLPRQLDRPARSRHQGRAPQRRPGVAVRPLPGRARAPGAARCRGVRSHRRRLDPRRPGDVRDQVPRRLRRGRRHQRTGPPRRGHRRRRGCHGRRRAHRPYHRRPAAGALPRRNDLLHRDGRGHRRHSRRELPVRAGTHRTFHPAVARRGRGQTPLRRLSPRSLVRSRIRRKPARWHDPRFSVTT